MRHEATDKSLSRRALLQALGQLGVAFGITAALPAFLGGCAVRTSPLDMPPAIAGLRALLPLHTYFGTAVDAKHLSSKNYAAAIARETNMLVPENDLKWRVVQPRAGVFNFKPYQRLARFATDNAMKMRGHTLVWHASLPEWAKEILQRGSKAEARAMMTAHMRACLHETADLVDDWDVVNEAVSPHSKRSDWLRDNSPWFKALGPDYVAEAFTTAHSLNAKLTMTYNDYSMEYADAAGYRRRAGVLQLLRRLKHEGVPVHQLGLQSHLHCHRPLAGEDFKTFLRQIDALGIKIIITELDLNLSKLPGSDAERLAMGANYATHYLRMINDVQPLQTIVSWGLSTPYSFMVKKDRTTLHPLPLDESMAPLPLWYSLRDFWLQSSQRVS